jgi:hypothetical protein
MKVKYTELSMLTWKKTEKKMTQVFKKSYVDSVIHSHFRYSEFGNPGDMPQSNSLERMHLTAIAGYLDYQLWCLDYPAMAGDSKLMRDAGCCQV